MSASWVVADWPAAANIVAGYTLRQGGVSTGRFESLNIATHVGDDAAAVAENRRRVVEACNLPSEPLWLNQVHGVRVASPGSRDGDADAIVADETNAVCVIQTADCLPILFVSAEGSEVAAAHAGWRGLADGVLEATVAAMRTRPRDVLAWIGPAISKDAFEVGEEVRLRFLETDNDVESCFSRNAAGRWQADLNAIARRRLTAIGIAEVSGGNRCTYSEPGDFFSFRRDGECGRMASFIYRREIP